MIHLASKLSFSNLDEIVVSKHFARLLRDEQPGIRTNTTVCLGKIAKYLHYSTRAKVLASAFGGKLKDPFPPARIAAVNALAATQQFYTLQETSSRIVPILCTLLTDTEKPVREQAFKVVKGFIQKLEQVSDDPTLKEEMEAMVKSSSEGSSSGVSSWASWAVGAIGAKFYKSSIKPPTSNANNSELTKSSNPGPLKLESKRDDRSSEELDLGGEDEKPTKDGWDDLNDEEAWESFEDGECFQKPCILSDVPTICPCN